MSRVAAVQEMRRLRDMAKTVPACYVSVIGFELHSSQ
jgi:hypothetical protein